nr:hypothetical protein [Prevotella sp. CAG:386]
MGKAVDPPLRVREDWWVFEKSLFNGKEGRGDFRKNPSLRLREDWWVFEKKRKSGGFSKNLKAKGKNWRFFEKIERKTY